MRRYTYVRVNIPLPLSLKALAVADGVLIVLNATNIVYSHCGADRPLPHKTRAVKRGAFLDTFGLSEQEFRNAGQHAHKSLRRVHDAARYSIAPRF